MNGGSCLKMTCILRVDDYCREAKERGKARKSAQRSTGGAKGASSSKNAPRAGKKTGNRGKM